MTKFTQDMAPAQYVEAGGIRFAYRRLGVPERRPLVFFQHFTGTLDDHDPAVSDAFAADREVIRIVAWRSRLSGRGGNAAPPPRKCQRY